MSRSLSDEERQIRAGYAKRARELAGELRHMADQLDWTPPPGSDHPFSFLPCDHHIETIKRLWPIIDSSGMVVSGRRQFIFALEQGVYLEQRSQGATRGGFNAVEEARRIFAGTHPEFAVKITPQEWEEAVAAVTNPVGAAPAGETRVSKWDVWMGILARIGLGGIDAVGLKRQYAGSKR
jgi:hypothetical protein